MLYGSFGCRVPVKFQTWWASPGTSPSVCGSPPINQNRKQARQLPKNTRAARNHCKVARREERART